MRQHSGIGVLDKAVGLLHIIGESPCGLAELCERSGLPRATTYRLAAALEVHRLLYRGHRYVVNADLSAYFDTIPHAELLQSIVG